MREVSIRIAPSSPKLESELLEFFGDHYTVEQKIQKQLERETYLYVVLEPKESPDAKP